MADGGNVIFKFLGDDSALKSSMSTLGKIGATALKGLAVATGAVTAGITAITTGTVKARGEFEQLEGGIQSMFGGIEKGQEQINKVMDLANGAWKSLTMSSNDYMTSFMSTYPLMKVDIEDQNEAIAQTHRIMTLNSDLANTFGYSMETATNAVNWALKGTYSYLDNLNIGIKGTKEGFLEAAKSVGYMVDSVDDLTSSEILDILEKCADRYGVLGKTADEAATTLTGSVASFKAAWQNFLSGTGDLGTVVETGRTAFMNLKRIIEEALPDIMTNLHEFFPEILQLVGEVLGMIGNLILENLPMILDMVGMMVDSIATAISEHKEQIAEIVGKLLQVAAKAILAGLGYLITSIQTNKEEMLAEIISGALEMGEKLLYNLAEAIYNNLYKFVSALISLKNKMVDKFNEMKAEALRKGTEMLANFITGVGNKIQAAVNKVNEIKTRIYNAFMTLVNNARNWGSDMINGFSQGIMDRVNGLISYVVGMVNQIRSLLHFSKPDEGPLRDYETWMPDFIDGLGKSLDSASPKLIGKVQDLASAMSLSPTLNGNVNNNLSPNVNVVVNNSYETDPLGQMVNTIKTFSNGAKNDYNYGYGG